MREVCDCFGELARGSLVGVGVVGLFGCGWSGSDVVVREAG